MKSLRSCNAFQKSSVASPADTAAWIIDPIGMQQRCDAAGRALIALPASTPSLRLLADQTADILAGFTAVLEGLALLVSDPARPRNRRGRMKLYVPDWLPSLINGGRAFVTIGAVELFWVATAWPNGGSAIVFVAIVVLLLSPRAEQAYAGALAFALGTTVGIPIAATVKFAVLPALETFPAFCLAMGAFLIPVGTAMAQSQSPALKAVFTALTFNLIPLLQPTNEMTYDTAQFYNSALGIFVGCVAAPLAFRLLPPLTAASRSKRLLALTLRDLRRLAIAAAIERRGLAGPHLQPARGIARSGRALAAGAAAIGAVGRDRNHPPSPRHAGAWPSAGTRLGAAGARPRE